MFSVSSCVLTFFLSPVGSRYGLPSSWPTVKLSIVIFFFFYDAQFSLFFILPAPGAFVGV